MTDESARDKAPAGWRWRFEDEATWHVQKNKPKWYSPIQRDIVIEPLFAAQKEQQS